MPRQGLKLKQASAVLQIQPKELQNLVQFGVVKPRRFEGTYFFDANALMVAKVASYLKESLGTRTSVLSKLMEAFSASEEEFKSENPKYIIFNCRLAAEEEPIKLGVPFRALGEQIEERMSRDDDTVLFSLGAPPDGGVPAVAGVGVAGGPDVPCRYPIKR